MSSPTADSAPRFRTAGPPGLAAPDIARRTRMVQAWRRHSSLIRLLRRVLPALCVALLLTLGGWALVNTLFARQGAASKSSVLVIRMLKPHFQGRDEKGQPYNVTADSAVRDDADPSRVSLEAPVFTLGSGLEEAHARARHGVFRDDTRMLDLSGDVHFDDGEGYHFVTEHAVIDLRKNNIDGEQPIAGNGPLGRITASSYAVRDGGAHAYFTGRVKARIEQQAAAADLNSASAKR